MSFEQFKTQVLLLHSEQSTLDNLSSGFNDRYTVHCATSGSEALNTLGSTQIDVIVSAHELPGMSGLEALREAKKRSPETIGILLAGEEDDDLQAVVGDKEVFEVVRGSVTADSLRRLIDNATQKARLLALAESANDTTASPDVEAEHIVMETSENGSSLITGGTGRMPALDPARISASADVGARSVDVLVLTHDEEFLATVKESARGLHNVIYANTVNQADEAISKHKIGVAVVDAAMVGTNVEKMTLHLRSQAPRLVAIVAGRRDDGEMLMDLINRGRVYRFLLKPVSPGRARLAIEASVKHHLESPDTAFKVSGQPGTSSTAKPSQEPKPAAKPDKASKPAPQSKPKAAPKPEPAQAPKQNQAPKSAPAKTAPAQPKPAAPAAPPRSPNPPETIVPNRSEALSPVDEGLGDAFGGSDTRFTETMTGIVASVTRSFRSKDREPDPGSGTESSSASAMDIDHPAMGSGGSPFGSSKMLVAGAVVLVAAGALGFWMYSGSGESGFGQGGPTPVAGQDAGQANPAQQSESILQTEVVIPEEIGIDALIDEARLAADAGQIYSPAGNNAIELYLAALDLAPGDPVAQIGLEETIDQTIGMAEAALLEHRADEASEALRGVELGDPDHPRLAFLKAQLDEMQLRDYLADARAAVRESRFEDAQAAILSARRLGVNDASEIEALESELNAARSDQRIDEVLARANARLDEGRLIAPSNDNARYYFELALSNDPGNAAARQGLLVVASKLVLQARAQLDAGRIDSAESLLADARRLDPSSSELAAVASAAQNLRAEREGEIRAAAERAAAERQRAERAADERSRAEQAAADRAEQERLAAAAAAAERAAAERAAAERRTAELATAQRSGAGRGATAAESAEAPAPEPSAAEPTVSRPPEQRPPSQQQVEQQPRQTVASQTNTQPAGNGSAVAPATAPSREPARTTETGTSDDPVAASTLQRTKYVAPKFPRAAQRRGVSGWVDVVFTVDIDGSVTDITVRESNPGDTFVNAAINAVEKWEFEPVIEDGVAIQKRAAVRMMFAIE